MAHAFNTNTLDLCEFKGSLVKSVSSRKARTVIQRYPVLKNQIEMHEKASGNVATDCHTNCNIKMSLTGYGTPYVDQVGFELRNLPLPLECKD